MPDNTADGALREEVGVAMALLGTVVRAAQLPPGTVEGQLSMVPREEGLTSKDLPVETLLKKIQMVRDKLRLVEQRVNASDALGAQEKLALQGLLTQAYAVLAGVWPLLATPPDAPAGTGGQAEE